MPPPPPPPAPISLPFDIGDLHGGGPAVSAGAPATLDGTDAADATWEAIAEAEDALDELVDAFEGDSPGAGTCAEEDRTQIMAVINTIDSVDDMLRGDGAALPALPAGTHAERALFARLVQADGLHDQGYATKEDFLRVTSTVVQAKQEMFGALRRRLEVLKEETAKAVRSHSETSAREPPAPAPAPEQADSAGWWPWAA